jgi:hypothetical protein
MSIYLTCTEQVVFFRVSEILNDGTDFWDSNPAWASKWNFVLTICHCLLVESS